MVSRDYLVNDNRCKELDEECLWGNRKGRCNFIDHYNELKELKKDESKPIAKKIAERASEGVFKNWKNRAKNKAEGKGEEGNKRLTGGPIQEAVGEVIEKELNSLGVTTNLDKEYLVCDGVNIRPDCLSQKTDRPLTIISVKTFLKPAEIRETFGSFYLAKKTKPDTMNFIVSGLNPTDAQLVKINGLKKAFEPFIDGIYYLSREPYIDELIKTLKDKYK